jgi:hypothetical protein
MESGMTMRGRVHPRTRRTPHQRAADAIRAADVSGDGGAATSTVTFPVLARCPAEGRPTRLEIGAPPRRG